MSEKNENNKLDRRLRVGVALALCLSLALCLGLILVGPHLVTQYLSAPVAPLLLSPVRAPAETLPAPAQPASPPAPAPEEAALAEDLLPETQDAVQDVRIEGLEKRLDHLETRLTHLSAQMDAKADENRIHDFITQAVQNALANVRRIPEMQNQFSQLQADIESGRPFAQALAAVRPYLAMPEAHRAHMDRFAKLAQQGVMPYARLKAAFRDVGTQVLCQPAPEMGWDEKMSGFFKAALCLRPAPRVIARPATAQDYVRTIEALLELYDTAGILALLQRAPLKQPGFLQWKQDFRAHCFAVDMHKILATHAFTVNFKGISA